MFWSPNLKFPLKIWSATKINKFLEKKNVGNSERNSAQIVDWYWIYYLTMTQFRPANKTNLFCSVYSSLNNLINFANCSAVKNPMQNNVFRPKKPRNELLLSVTWTFCLPNELKIKTDIFNKNQPERTNLEYVAGHAKKLLIWWIIHWNF